MQASEIKLTRPPMGHAPRRDSSTSCPPSSRCPPTRAAMRWKKAPVTKLSRLRGYVEEGPERFCRQEHRERCTCERGGGVGSSLRCAVLMSRRQKLARENTLIGLRDRLSRAAPRAGLERGDPSSGFDLGVPASSSSADNADRSLSIRCSRRSRSSRLGCSKDGPRSGMS